MTDEEKKAAEEKKAVEKKAAEEKRKVADTETKEKLEKIAKGISDVQDMHTKLEKKYDTLDADSLNKAKEGVTKLAEQLQTHQVKVDAQEKLIETMGKQFLRSIETPEKKGEFSNPAYEHGIAKYFRKGVIVETEAVQAMAEEFARKHLYGADEAEIKEFATKDLVAGSNVDGGFFLSSDRTARVSTRVFETSPMRTLATVETTTSDIWEIILDDDEPDSGWVGEISARPDTDTAQIGLLRIPIHELYAQPKATQKMLDDAGFDIAGWHQRKVTAKFSRDENTSFVVGDGASKCRGFLTYAAWAAAGVYERNAVEQIDSATTVVIEGDDVIRVQGALIEDYQSRASWAMHRTVFFNNILTLKDGEDNYLFNPMLIALGADLVLLGKRVVFFGDMPVVAQNALPIAYGDWSEFYTIIDRFGIRVLRDPYTLKPYVRFYTTKRVGGAVTNFEAVKLLKII